MDILADWQIDNMGLDDDDDDDRCQTCGGYGVEYGEDLIEEDPLWWQPGDVIKCRNCGGSGKARDQRYW